VVGHYGFSVIMASVYLRYARQRLPGPGWVRGILFLLMENVVLYPLGLITDRTHAGVRARQLAPVTNRKTFCGQLTRHAAFGLVLGLVGDARYTKRKTQT
jgi:hypothetical protein